MLSHAGLALALVACAAAEGPCDILAAAGNPCVAAHSTVRALFSSYAGALYNVTRPDGQSFSVPLLAPGGYANKSAHDSFCPLKDCVVSNIYDQSPNGNHLGKRHKLVNASQHPIVAGANAVYGLWFDPGFGYHVDATKNIATGNEPESIYAVMSGTHYNGGCEWGGHFSRRAPHLPPAHVSHLFPCTLAHALSYSLNFSQAALTT
jgi:hypothetical protein